MSSLTSCIASNIENHASPLFPSKHATICSAIISLFGSPFFISKRWIFQTLNRSDSIIANSGCPTFRQRVNPDDGRLNLLQFKFYPIHWFFVIATLSLACYECRRLPVIHLKTRLFWFSSFCSVAFVVGQNFSSFLSCMHYHMAKSFKWKQYVYQVV